MMPYDIFISYRRVGGEYTAKILHDKLTQRGYQVFFDVESLRSGEFNRRLFSVIDECTDFLLVLSPGSLDRCGDPQDWVRQELAYAIAQKKNIIPVMLRNFSFPVTLPQEIDAVRWCNGLEASAEFFDAFLEKLIEFFKTPAPKRGKKRWLLALICVLTALAVAAGIWWGMQRTARAPAETGNGQPLPSAQVAQASPSAPAVPEGMRLYEDERLSFCYPEQWLLAQKDAEGNPLYRGKVDGTAYEFQIADVSDDLTVAIEKYTYGCISVPIVNAGAFGTEQIGGYTVVMTGALYQDEDDATREMMIACADNGHTRVAMELFYGEGADARAMLTQILETLIIK